jgi:hypothetical protein
MTYQPNPIVDPARRGFEMPAGCKDLHQMLTRVPGGQLGAPSRVKAGTTGTVRSYVAPLDEAKSQCVARAVMNFESGALLTISRRESGFDLTLLLHKGSAFLQEAIVELFGEAILASSGRTDDELQTVHIPLPDSWDDAAQRLIDLLIRGFGLPENARLLFHYQERKVRT